MRANEFLAELFEPNPTQKIEWSKPYKDELRAQAITPKGHKLDIGFWEINPDMIAIAFTVDAPDNDDSPRGYELTQHGEEFAVFNLVLNSTKQYLQSSPKTDIFFQVKKTEEAQRMSLYLKLAARVASQLGFRRGSMEELQQTKPKIAGQFDQRFNQLLWYTRT